MSVMARRKRAGRPTCVWTRALGAVSRSECSRAHPRERIRYRSRKIGNTAPLRTCSLHKRSRPGRARRHTVSDRARDSAPSRSADTRRTPIRCSPSVWVRRLPRRRRQLLPRLRHRRHLSRRLPCRPAPPFHLHQRTGFRCRRSSHPNRCSCPLRPPYPLSSSSYHPNRRPPLARPCPRSALTSHSSLRPCRLRRPCSPPSPRCPRPLLGRSCHPCSRPMCRPHRRYSWGGDRCRDSRCRCTQAQPRRGRGTIEDSACVLPFLSCPWRLGGSSQRTR